MLVGVRVRCWLWPLSVLVVVGGGRGRCWWCTTKTNIVISVVDRRWCASATANVHAGGCACGGWRLRRLVTGGSGVRRWVDWCNVR